MNKTKARTRFASLMFIVVTLCSAAAQAIIVRTGVVYRPVARAVVGTAAIVGTAAVVGSMVNTLPPSCGPVVVGNVAYQHCGNTWYQPQYAGSQVNYIVVNPPAAAPPPQPAPPPQAAPPPY